MDPQNGMGGLLLLEVWCPEMALSWMRLLAQFTCRRMAPARMARAIDMPESGTIDTAGIAGCRHQKWRANADRPILEGCRAATNEPHLESTVNDSTVLQIDTQGTRPQETALDVDTSKAGTDRAGASGGV
jgi:hypothetical protein